MIAFITARGGSKGLPRKNVLTMGGHPPIAWTIKAASEVKEIHTVYVSTDFSSSDQAIAHSLRYLKIEKKENSKAFIFLQPTSPLRNAKRIEESIYLFKKNKSRQSNLSIADAIINCEEDTEQILSAIKRAKGSSFEPLREFGEGNSSKQFIKTISKESFWDVSKQKVFNDLH